MAETQSLNIKEGRDLRDNDGLSAIIGVSFIEKELIGKNLKLRGKIKINGREFVIVGILERTGDPGRDNSIFIPEDTLREVFSEPDKIDTIMAKVANVENIETIAEKIKNDLRRFRNVKKDEEDFDVETPEQLLGSFGDVVTLCKLC